MMSSSSRAPPRSAIRTRAYVLQHVKPPKRDPVKQTRRQPRAPLGEIMIHNAPGPSITEEDEMSTKATVVSSNHGNKRAPSPSFGEGSGLEKRMRVEGDNILDTEGKNVVRVPGGECEPGDEHTNQLQHPPKRRQHDIASTPSPKKQSIRDVLMGDIGESPPRKKHKSTTLSPLQPYPTATSELETGDLFGPNAAVHVAPIAHVNLEDHPAVPRRRTKSPEKEFKFTLLVKDDKVAVGREAEADEKPAKDEESIATNFPKLPSLSLFSRPQNEEEIAIDPVPTPSAPRASFTAEDVPSPAPSPSKPPQRQTRPSAIPRPVSMLPRPLAPTTQVSQASVARAADMPTTSKGEKRALHAQFKPPTLIQTRLSFAPSSKLLSRQSQKTASQAHPSKPLPSDPQPSASTAHASQASLPEPELPPRPSSSLGHAADTLGRRATLAPDTQASLSSLSQALEKLSLPRVAFGRSVSGGAPPSAATSTGTGKTRPIVALGRSRTISGAIGRVGVGLGAPPLASARARAGRSVSAEGVPLREVMPNTAPSLGKGTSVAAPNSFDEQRSKRASLASQALSQTISDEHGQKDLKGKGKSLVVLKGVVAFVDVRTDDGNDASELFIKMLQSLGARVLTRPTPSVTHIVFKSGLPSTLTKHKLYDDPKPFLVGVAWVVECGEQRLHVDENNFLVADEDVRTWGGKRRKSMQPRQMKALTDTLKETTGNSSLDDSISSRDQSMASLSSSQPSSSRSFLRGGPSGLPRIAESRLEPVERVRRRNLLFAPKVSSPLRLSMSRLNDFAEE